MMDEIQRKVQRGLDLLLGDDNRGDIHSRAIKLSNCTSSQCGCYAPGHALLLEKKVGSSSARATPSYSTTDLSLTSCCCR